MSTPVTLAAVWYIQRSPGWQTSGSVPSRGRRWLHPDDPPGDERGVPAEDSRAGHDHRDDLAVPGNLDSLALLDAGEHGAGVVGELPD
jgi:hypothetical protein